LASVRNKRDHGLLLQWFEAAVQLLVRLSLGKKLEAGRASNLDIYVLVWLALEIIILTVMALVPLVSPVKTTLVILFSYHLFEIGVTSFSSVIIAPIQGKRHSTVPRIISLVLIDYIEIIFIFAIILKFAQDGEPVLKSLQQSVSLSTLAGVNFDSESTSVFLASIFEMLFGVFFVTGIIATLANYIGAKE
jgi:hypothetical protein